MKWQLTALSLVLVVACGGAPPRERVAQPAHEPGDEAASNGDERGQRLRAEREIEPGHSDEPDDDDDLVEVLEVLEGRASYYSDRLAGRSTASGEPYRLEALTAASRDLPFHSLLRVTRLDDHGNALGSVRVRVNDRGPFGDHSRILDLSRAAAEELDMIRAGVVNVRVEVLRRGR